MFNHTAICEYHQQYDYDIMSCDSKTKYIGIKAIVYCIGNEHKFVSFYVCKFT